MVVSSKSKNHSKENVISMGLHSSIQKIFTEYQSQARHHIGRWKHKNGLVGIALSRIYYYTYVHNHNIRYKIINAIKV